MMYMLIKSVFGDLYGSNTVGRFVNFWQCSIIAEGAVGLAVCLVVFNSAIV